MSDTTSTTWKCDRCGFEDERDQREQPSHWRRLYSVTPPRASVNDVASPHGDLCLACWRALGSFLANAPVGATVRAPVPPVETGDTPT